MTLNEVSGGGDRMKIIFHKFSSLFRLFLFFAAQLELMKFEYRWILSTFILLRWHVNEYSKKQLDNMRNNAIIIILMLSFEHERAHSWNVENEEESQKSFNFILSERFTRQISMIDNYRDSLVLTVI